MGRRVICLLLCLVLLAGAVGCHHVDSRYWGLQLSGQYEDWADSEGLLLLYPPVNPFWWFGVLLLAFDLICAPVTFLHDLVVYLEAEPGTLPAPWDLMAARRWRTPAGP